MNEPKDLKNLHKIREEHYEAPKHLSTADYIKKLHQETEALKKKLSSQKEHRIC